MVNELGIDVKSVVDEVKNFSQTLLFPACVVRDSDLAFKMVKLLHSLGVDARQEDTLKQTPLFYASR